MTIKMFFYERKVSISVLKRFFKCLFTGWMGCFTLPACFFFTYVLSFSLFPQFVLPFNSVPWGITAQTSLHSVLVHFVQTRPQPDPLLTSPCTLSCQPQTVRYCHLQRGLFSPSLMQLSSILFVLLHPLICRLSLLGLSQRSFILFSCCCSGAFLPLSFWNRCQATLMCSQRFCTLLRHVRTPWLLRSRFSFSYSPFLFCVAHYFYLLFHAPFVLLLLYPAVPGWGPVPSLPHVRIHGILLSV